MGLQDIIITGIDSIQTVSRTKRQDGQICNRPRHGLSFCLEGQITYVMDGKEYISTPHNAVFLPEGATYTSYTDRAGSFPLINFHCATPPTNEILVINLQNPESYLAQFEQLKKTFLLPHGKLRSFEQFYGILGRLAVENEAQHGLLAPAMAYLEDHIHDPNLSNAALASQLGYSEVYFRKLFTQVYGCSPHSYILELRIRQAKQLLSDGILSVGAIAEQCGFSSVYHFSRSFKRMVGLSPTEYSRQNRQSKL